MHPSIVSMHRIHTRGCILIIYTEYSNIIDVRSNEAKKQLFKIYFNEINKRFKRELIFRFTTTSSELRD